MPDLPNRRVTIVDDGIFTGGTIKEFLKIARRNGIQLDVQRVIGFIGTGKSVDEKKPYRDILEPVLDLYEWIDARDFTPVGGTRFSQSRLNKVTTAIPYLFPWSDGGSASLDMEPAFFDISGKLISSFQELVREYERITGTQLTFRDVVKKGFPFPTDAAKKLPITLNTRVIDYLDMCLEKIQQERERPVAIFDMDGTLYKLDGEESGFRGSSLERSVRENAEVFVMKRELCNIDKARTIIAIGQNNVVGLSQYLADRYGISRAEYFNEVWDIDPSNIISGEPSLGNAIQEFIKRNPNVKPVIVSSAPSIWVRRVLKHLGVEDAFELVIAGEKYGVKDEVFRMLSKRYYELSRMVSIGDQMGTDIRPAQKEGIHGILVQGPNETASVLAWLEL
jgi:FMN phosphatase YigB (HAD superfamily)